MTRNERTEAMQAHVAAQAQSGKSRKRYCQEHDLKLHVLNYWCRRMHRTAARKGFASVEVTAERTVELHYPNGVRLLLPAGTALDHVAACIRLY